MQEEGKASIFVVKFDQLSEIKFRSCLGMNFEVEPIFYPEAGTGTGVRSSRGQVMGSQVQFAYGTVEDQRKGSSSQSVASWLMGVMNLDERLDKRDGRISLQNDQGATLAKWKIQKAWPCRWEGPELGSRAEDLTIDRVTFVHEGIQRMES